MNSSLRPKETTDDRRDDEPTFARREDPLQIFFDSLLLIGVYSIGAMGFALIGGVLNVLNIAHSTLIMLGDYLTLSFVADRYRPPVETDLMAIVFTTVWDEQCVVFFRRRSGIKRHPAPYSFDSMGAVTVSIRRVAKMMLRKHSRSS